MESKKYEELGQKVRTAREEANIDANDIKHVISQGNLSATECGRRKFSEKVAKQLAPLYKVDYQYLLGYQPYKNEQDRILQTIAEVKKNASSHYGYFQMLGYRFYGNDNYADVGENILVNEKTGDKVHINYAVEELLINTIDKIVCDVFDSYFESDVKYLKYGDCTILRVGDSMDD